MPSDKGGLTRTKFTYVKVPIYANRMQKPMPKAARSCGLRRCPAHAAKGEGACAPAGRDRTVRPTVKQTRAATTRLSAAKNRKVDARQKCSATQAEISRPIRLLPTLPVT